jgi:hypothetical protein
MGRTTLATLLLLAVAPTHAFVMAPGGAIVRSAPCDSLAVRAVRVQAPKAFIG